MHGNWLRMVSGVVVLLSCLITQTGLGVDYYWNNTAGGAFETPGNWTPSGPPASSADKAYFTNRADYSVSVTVPVTNGALTIRGGEVTFGAPGHNYTVASLDIINAANSVYTNTLILSNTIVKIQSTGNTKLNDPLFNGTYKLLLKNGAQWHYGNAGGGHLYINANSWHAGSTSMIVVADAGSLLTGTNLGDATLYSDSLNGLYVTNGGTVRCRFFRTNYNAGNTNLPHRAQVMIGGGSGESLVFVSSTASYNQFGGTGSLPSTDLIVREGSTRLQTTELTILPNGRLAHGVTGTILFPGATLTLAGGVVDFDDAASAAVFTVGGAVRGSGMIRLVKNDTVNKQIVTVREYSNAGITNYGSISPGMPDSPIGTITISNRSPNAYIEVRTNCSLNFDLAGPTTDEYDRIVATNLNVYLGTYASPYVAQGGAVINVSLTNNYVPSGLVTYDVLVAKDIADANLAGVTFNYPAQPATITWGASIVTNAGTGFTNEILRISASRPSRGTLIYVW